MAGHAIQPMSVEQIVQQAENFEYNPLVPFRHWSRSAGTLLKEAEIYESEGNEQQAYLLLFRHARLILDKLPAHPEARLPENENALQQLSKDVLRNISKLETLKPRINKRHERYTRLLKEKIQAKAASTRPHLTSPPRSVDPANGRDHSRLSSDPALNNGSEALAAGDNRDLAVQLAHQEIERRATARKATRLAGILEEQEQERRTAGLWADWEKSLYDNDQSIERDHLRKQMQKLRLQANGSKVDSRDHKNYPDPAESEKARFQYPSIPPSRPSSKSGFETAHLVPGTTLNKSADSHSALTSQPPPLRPPKHTVQCSDHSASNQATHEIPYAQSSPQPIVSPVKQEPKPATFTFKPSAYLENGTPLRTIFLPPDLRHHFLSIALTNTRANLETCGILCGTLISNALFISKLVIPQQESTSDTCEMMNESDFFDYVDGEDLMVLGWIHTHPTQTCFMSSRDLHTHCGYQVMMPESIAIVCAPSKSE
ncbi:MAG: hypothetical protein LQ348_001718 [Seirophora lacunosa]|nr:MAG: hypothetical protein LQ344_005071 [Seirophora lacunosa]KAI4200879.1 MAG: hypothetical protein LQ348_001718 [Seirophora lacunosa]